MIDTAHHKPEIVGKLAELMHMFGTETAEGPLAEICDVGFKGEQSIEFYNGLFSGYVNAYGLIQECGKGKGKEELIVAFGVIVTFVASKLQEMQRKHVAWTATQKFTPEQALKEYEEQWEPTTEERNHLRQLFERLAGRNPTKLVEGANCPKCDGKIGKDNYCRDCGYGL